MPYSGFAVIRRSHWTRRIAVGYQASGSQRPLCKNRAQITRRDTCGSCSTRHRTVGSSAVAHLVVCKNICFSLGAADAGQDLVRVLGPGERARVVVPGVDEGADGVHELADGGEGAA